MESKYSRSESCYGSEIRTLKNIGLGRETDLDDVFLGATPTNYRWADLELQCAFIALSLMTNGTIWRELYCKSIRVPLIENSTRIG